MSTFKNVQPGDRVTFIYRVVGGCVPRPDKQITAPVNPMLIFDDHVIVNHGPCGSYVNERNFIAVEPRPDHEAERERWISYVADAVKGDAKLGQGVADILNEFAEIFYCDAPGESDPSPFMRRAEAYVFEQLRLLYPNRPESDLKDAARAAVGLYEIW